MNRLFVSSSFLFLGSFVWLATAAPAPATSSSSSSSFSTSKAFSKLLCEIVLCLPEFLLFFFPLFFLFEALDRL
jgi:hypothetical protein